MIKSNQEVGNRIRFVRESLGLSRAELCGDETKLSQRQLYRIEEGSSEAGISKIQYIAKTCGKSIDELLGTDHVIIPEEYYQLKRELNRSPYYNDEELKKHYKILEEIYENHISILPEEELLYLELKERIYDHHRDNNNICASELFGQRFKDIFKKRYLKYNDLLMINYQFSYMYHNPDFNYEEFSLLLKRLLRVKISRDFDFNDRLLVSLGNAAGVLIMLKEYSDLKIIFDRMNTIMEETQQFALKPNVLVIEAKYHYYHLKDNQTATNIYDTAKIIAKSFNDKYLEEAIMIERQVDNL